jgi:hypothetical protein
MPGNYPKEKIQHTEHSEGLKSELLWLITQKNNNALWCVKKYTAFIVSNTQD